MTDRETIRKAREALEQLELAKNRKEKIRQKIRELRAEMEKEDVTILSCLEVLASVPKARGDEEKNGN